MEQKHQKKRIWLIGIGIAAVAVLAVLVAVFCSFLLKGYRMIKLEQLQGSVRLERSSAELPPYEGMSLTSGDKVTTGSNGLVTLRVDEDKHIAAEMNTRFSIEAVGTEENGRIEIKLEYGSSLFEIENKLPSGSSFEVTTPNATLGVRGTTFRVTYDKTTSTTTVTVTEGTVEVRTVKETRPVEAGETVYIVDEADTVRIEDSFNDTQLSDNTDVSGGSDASSQGQLTMYDVLYSETLGLLQVRFQELEYVIRLAQHCHLASNENYVATSLTYLWNDPDGPGAGVTVPGKVRTYDIEKLNHLYHLLTDDTISEYYISPMSRIEGNELIYEAPAIISPDGWTKAGIRDIRFGQDSEILVEYDFSHAVSTEIYGTSIAHFRPMEDGTYRLQSIEEVDINP